MSLLVYTVIKHSLRLYSAEVGSLSRRNKQGLELEYEHEHEHEHEYEHGSCNVEAAMDGNDDAHLSV